MKTRHHRHIAPNGFNEWPSDDEVRNLQANVTPASLKVIDRALFDALNHLKRVAERLPEQSDTLDQLLEYGQGIYNLAGFICSAIDANNGNYDWPDARAINDSAYLRDLEDVR